MTPTEVRLTLQSKAQLYCRHKIVEARYILNPPSSEKQSMSCTSTTLSTRRVQLPTSTSIEIEFGVAFEVVQAPPQLTSFVAHLP